MLFKESLTVRIQNLLVRNEKARDSDSYLLACIWRQDLEREHTESVYSFLGKLSRGEVTSPESVRRSRQKLQEEYPQLRGERYHSRKKTWEPVARMEVKEWLPKDQTSLF